MVDSFGGAAVSCTILALALICLRVLIVVAYGRATASIVLLMQRGCVSLRAQLLGVSSVRVCVCAKRVLWRFS